jgi:hypothetical protein
LFKKFIVNINEYYMEYIYIIYEKLNAYYELCICWDIINSILINR